MKYILAILISCSLIPQLLFAADPSGTPTAAEIARYKDLVQNDIDIIMYRPKEPHTPEVEKKWQDMLKLEEKIKAAESTPKPKPAPVSAPKPTVSVAETTPKNVQDAIRAAETRPHNIDFNPPKEAPFPTTAQLTRAENAKLMADHMKAVQEQNSALSKTGKAVKNLNTKSLGSTFLGILGYLPTPSQVFEALSGKTTDDYIDMYSAKIKKAEDDITVIEDQMKIIMSLEDPSGYEKSMEALYKKRNELQYWISIWEGLLQEKLIKKYQESIHQKYISPQNQLGT